MKTRNPNPEPVTSSAEAPGGVVAAPVLSIAKASSDEPTRVDQRREDRELVHAILDGDQEAFSRLYELHAKKIYRFAVKRLKDPVEAEDVVQDTFLEIHRCLASWEGRSRLLSWMFGIAHHQLCRRFRKKSPISLPMEMLEASPIAVVSMDRDERIDATRALEACADLLEQEVSTGQREIFHLYYGENRPMKEIAGDLGKSNQAIKISLFRTRRAMAERLAELDFRQAG